MNKIKPKFIIVFMSIIIVIGMVGWVLFFFISITGKITSELEPIPPADPYYSPKFEIIPPGPGLSPGEVKITECDKAKISREFVCSAWEDRYGSSCNFWQVGCKAIRDLCREAQEEVEKMCSSSVIGS